MKRILYVLLAGASLSAAGQDLNALKAINVSNGETVSLGDYTDSPGIVIIFTSNVCPYDAYYTGRIAGLIDNYGSRVPFVLVNSNSGENESVAAMKEKVSEWDLGAPYLADKEQSLLAGLKGQKSPEAFILKRTGDQLEVFYRGAIDDNAQVPGDVHESYLKEAIDAMLANKAPARDEVRAVGCLIRKR